MAKAKIGHVGRIGAWFWWWRLLFSPSAGAAGKTVYVGGTLSLTGPFAEDSAAVLAAIEDYVKYVNETKQSGPVAQREISRRYQT